MLRCEKCGFAMPYIAFDLFNFDGSDSFAELDYEEVDENAVVVDTEQNWTGYELDESEWPETIQCPNCGEYPFKDTEIHVYNIVQVVMFRGGKGADEITKIGGDTDDKK